MVGRGKSFPSVLGKMLQDKDAGKAKRVMNAMLQMGKIEINRLPEAYEQESTIKSGRFLGD
jgi:hypothetical protein